MSIDDDQIVKLGRDLRLLAQHFFSESGHEVVDLFCSLAFAVNVGDESVERLQSHHAFGDSVKAGGIFVQMKISKDGALFHGDDVGVQRKPGQAEGIDKCEGSVDSFVFETSLAKQGQLGHEQDVKVWPLSTGWS